MAPRRGRLEIRLLGSLEVVQARDLIAISGPKPRALLANLALHLCDVVSTDRLIEDLWSGSPPPSAAHALQVYISKLRAALDPKKTGLISSRAPGYALELPPEALDLNRFERLVNEGRGALREGNPSSAAASLRQALSVWRGPALADFMYEPFAQSDIARLEDLRTATRESLVDAELDLGHHIEVLPEIEALAAENPFAERPRAQLMLGLYRAGRQAHALEAYRNARQELVEELGVEPSTMLRELEQAILRQDASLELPTAATWPVEERRKMVTVLFADLVGSSTLAEELDPESWSGVQRRLFSVLGEALERHGGTVEKFAGDAVMAVFGVPKAHEDDAFRAVRAAVAMRTGLAALDAELEREERPELALRIGVNTGEVFAGGPADGPLVSGSVVNVAKRLEEAALPGQILLGTGTLALVRHAVKTKQLRARRGGGAAVPAYVLVDMIAGAPAIARYVRAPLVGREGELAVLRNAFEEARSEGRCRLVTVIGEAGIGKTRLANELIASLGEEATALVGRCVSYGEGATYLPLTEMVRDVDLETVLAGADDGEFVAMHVRGLIGVSERSASSGEAFWAVRHLCEALARAQPLVLVFEDLHWGEPTLLDLIEHIQERAQGPIFLLCVARPEILDKRPAWDAGTLAVAPLPEEDSLALVASLPGASELHPEARTRILETAEGNPLFVEQLFAHVQDEGAERSAPIPPTISALLTARLDGLPEAERVVLERASVEGKLFQRAALVELTPEQLRPTIGEHLVALVRRGLVRPERPGGDMETLRFHHDLVRDAAYESLPKQTRLELHERLAEWLEVRKAAPDEILGYHLERAYRYQCQLGITSRDDHLARGAAKHLASAGIRALQRGDEFARANLLDRAVALLPAEAPERIQLLPGLADALFSTDELSRGLEVADEAVLGAQTLGDEALELRALMAQVDARSATDPAFRIDEFAQLAERAIPVFERAHDEQGLAESYHRMFQFRWWRCETVAAAELAEQALAHASRAGDSKLQGEAVAGSLRSILFGPWTAEEGLRKCAQIRGAPDVLPWLEVAVLEAEAYLGALRGRFDEARLMLRRAEETAQDIGVMWPALMNLARNIELLAEDAVAAEQLERAELAKLERMDRPHQVGIFFRALGLAEALCAQGRYEEAAQLIIMGEQAVSSDNPTRQVWGGRLRARVLASREDFEDAQRVVYEAVAVADRTDMPSLRGPALMDLAEIERLAGKPAEATSAAARALDVFQQKGNLPSARRARVLLDQLRPPRPTSVQGI